MATDPIEEHLKTRPAFYVSITGLRIRGWLSVLPFWKHAVRSKMQADRAPGLLFAQVKRIDGVEHTLTAWESRDAMKAYVSSGPHLQAMKAFRKIATGKTLGFETSRLPSWEEARKLWEERGQEY